MTRRFQSMTLALSLTCFTMIGCQERATIQSYSAPKEEVFTAEEVTSQRMLGAILPADDAWWFLKVTGDPEDIGKIDEQFETFALSVDVSSPAPKWDLPEGWQEMPGSEFRYKTIRIPVDDKHLDLSVTTLPSPGDTDEYLLSNVNRWRGQLGLPSIEETELSTSLKKVPRDGKSPVYLCDLEGTTQMDAMSAAPFASGDSAANSNQISELSSDSPSEDGFREQVPPQWKPGKLSSMRRAAYMVADGDQKAEVTVVPLGRESGDVLGNVTRWRGQIGLPPIDESELAGETKSIEVQGKPESYFVMHGPTDAPNPQSILVVMVPRSGSVWFIKMSGDSDLVRREQQRFEEYARTIQLQ